MPSFEIDDFPALAKARLLWTSGARDAALDAFRAAIAERPRNVKALLEAARGLGARFEISEAEAFLDEAGRLAGDDPGVALQIAVSRGRFHREQRAIIELEAISHRSALIRAELTALYERANRLDDALAEIEACVRMAPSAPEPRLAHARILRRLGKGKEVVPLLKSLTRSDLSPAVRAEAWTELCHIHDGDGDAGSAAQMIAEAHAIVRSLPQMSDLMARARVNNRTIGALSLEFTSERLERWKAEEPAIDPRVSGIAHLVGFPRSGTTLLEQCLDAHPDLVASPERAIFTQETLPGLCQAAGGPLSIETLDAVPTAALYEARTRYLDHMEAALGQPLGGRLHLDKNPNHTGLLGALLRLFPSARIIFALRDPRDVVTSCVLRTFRPTEFSAMLLDWGTAAELYAAEMSAWLRYRDRVAANQWVQTRYEDMVADPMSETARVLAALGLGWDDGVTRYRDRLEGKIVNSPTQTEVTQPIHARAVGRWRAYRRHLAPHMHVLAPFISAFGYD